MFGSVRLSIKAEPSNFVQHEYNISSRMGSRILDDRLRKSFVILLSETFRFTLPLST